eukprot:780814-Prymnesium_polylepis.2
MWRYPSCSAFFTVSSATVSLMPPVPRPTNGSCTPPGRSYAPASSAAETPARHVAAITRSSERASCERAATIPARD